MQVKPIKIVKYFNGLLLRKVFKVVLENLVS